MNRKTAKSRKRRGYGWGPREVDRAIARGLLGRGDAREAATRELLSGPFGEEESHLALLAERLGRLALLALGDPHQRERLRELAALRSGREGGAFLLREAVSAGEETGFGSLRLARGALLRLAPEIKQSLRRLQKRTGRPVTLDTAAGAFFLALRFGPGRLSPALRRISIAASYGDIRPLKGLLATPAAPLVRAAAREGNPGEPLYWPGLGSGPSFGGFTDLVKFQARECCHTYELAARASRGLGAPVLLLCNASLAGSVAWGVPGLHHQVAPKDAQSFAKAVRRHGRAAARRIRANKELSTLIEGMVELFRKRIVAPGLARLLGDLGALAAVRSEPSLLDGPMVKRAESLSASEERGRLAPRPRSAGSIFEEMSLLVQAYDLRKESFGRLLALLRGILAAGEESLPKSGLVVPWVDKFFMSSKREGDTEYLAKVCLAVKELCPKSPIILVDDTKRKRDPSLKLAINALNKKGFSARGLTAFGGAGKEPIDVILAMGAGPLFYAVRPFLDTHNPRSFMEVLAEARAGLLSEAAYDSSWKDGADFLYAGTAIEPLAARPDSRDPSPYVFVREGVATAGRVWRALLRGEALRGYGPGKGPLGEVWRDWARLANLL